MVLLWGAQLEQALTQQATFLLMEQQLQEQQKLLMALEMQLRLTIQKVF